MERLLEHYRDALTRKDLATHLCLTRCEGSRVYLAVRNLFFEIVFLHTGFVAASVSFHTALAITAALQLSFISL